MLRRINRSAGQRVLFARAQSAAAAQPKTSGLWAAYQRAVATRPMTTALVTSSVLWAAGDAAAQRIESALGERDESDASVGEVAADQAPVHTFSFRRLAATTAVGSLMTGAGGLWWYAFLDRIVKLRFGLTPRTVPFVAAKLGMELAFFHPFTLVFFWTGVGLVTGQSLAQIWGELQTKFFPTLGGEIALWLPIDAANFFFVPVHLQFFVVNMGALLEAVFLSYVHARGFPGSGASPKAPRSKSDAADQSGLTTHARELPVAVAV